MKVKFRTNKLAREKGFVNGTNLYPTQTELQTWLRTKHEIIVCAVPNFYNRSKLLGYIYTLDRFVNAIHDGNDYDSEMLHSLGSTSVELDTFEEALEVGLEEALKLII